MLRMLTGLAVATVLVASGCALVPTEPVPTSSPTVYATTETVPPDPVPTVTATVTVTVTATPSAAVSSPADDCGTVVGLRLRVVSGAPSCADVRRVAGEWNPEGEKVQDIDGWRCASGTAATRPVVFTCIRDAEEFTAEDA